MAILKSTEPQYDAIAVVFDPAKSDPFSFDGGTGPFSITTGQPYNMLIFNLTLAPTPDPKSLAFTATPVDWGQEAPGMNVMRMSDSQVVIVDWNSNLGADPIAFPFTVAVLYGETMYTSSDPTIMNAQIPPT